MGYLVVASIMGYISFYIITFTATFGWKVSWVWYYTGIAAIFMQYVIFDPLISTFHWLLARRWIKCGRRMQKCRSMSQGFNETYDLSDGEYEAKKLRKAEEKAKEKEEKRQKKLAKKKVKAAKNKVTLFNEEQNHDTHGGNADLFGEGHGAPSVAASIAVSELPHEEFKDDQKIVRQESGSDSNNRGKSSGHDTADDALNGGNGSSSGNHSDSKNYLLDEDKKRKKKQD